MACESASFSLRGVSVDYGAVRALHGVDLDVPAGSALALVGPSGAGKTTLLRVMAGAIRPGSGRVIYNGNAWQDLPPRRLRRARACVGMIHQDLGLVPGLRVLKNVLAGRLGRMGLLRSLRVMLHPPRDLVLEAHEILERVGIGDKLYERTERLSGGQQQRVALARALFQDPGALLADEPVASVDPARARDLIALLREVSSERGLTLCVSLHDLELAREFFPRLVGLRQGRIVFDAEAETLDGPVFEELYRLEGAAGDA